MSGSLRVLSLGTLYSPYAIGGYEIVWRDTVARLREQGHEVKVLASDWTGSHNGEEEEDTDIRRELSLYIDDLLDVRDEGREEVLEREQRNRRLIDQVLEEFRPDVAFLGPVGGLPLSVVTRISERGVSQIAFVGDEWPKYGPKTDPGQRLFGLAARLFGRRSGVGIEGRRFRYGDVDHWVCGSQRSAEVLKRAGADPATTTVLPPGPDTGRFTRRHAKAWRGELLYAGRLHPNEGAEQAIRALVEAKECRLKIAGVGDPRDAERLQRIAAELGVEDRMEMLGDQHDRMPDVYAEADAVVFPSARKEPWDLVPLEAMAVGRPVIASAAGGAAEYLRDGENSLVVPAGDATAIARAAEQLGGDEELRARLAEGGFATADEYRYDRFLDRLAGAVVALGERLGEEGQDTSVSESHEPEPEASGPEATQSAAQAAARAEPEPAPAQENATAKPKPAPAQEDAIGASAQATAAKPRPVKPAANGGEGPPKVDEWLPEGYEVVEREPRTSRPETTEWAAVPHTTRPAQGRPVSDEVTERQPPPAPARPPAAAAPAGPPAAGSEVNLFARLAALEARVGELSTSAVTGIERNAAELTAIERRLTELLPKIDSRVGELADRQGSELGSLRTRVSELAAFAELRVEALGQQVDEFKQILTTAEAGLRASIQKLGPRLDALERRVAAADQSAGRAEAAAAVVGDLAARLERVERLVGEVWEGEQIAAQATQRPVAANLGELEGLAKLNKSSFEQLRTLGLSGTQAARLLAARGARSGFDSVDELEGIPGFPPTLIEELRQAVQG